MSLEDYLRDVEKELPTGKLVCSSAVTQMALFLAFRRLQVGQRLVGRN